MEGITIVETAALDHLINRIARLEEVIKNLETGGPTWMDAKETADYMRKSTSWVYHNKSLIGFSKPGADILFNRKKVDAYLERVFFQSSR